MIRYHDRTGPWGVIQNSPERKRRMWHQDSEGNRFRGTQDAARKLAAQLASENPQQTYEPAAIAGRDHGSP
jgi:hypothetical protein